MASDSPSPNHVRKQVACPPSPTMSPSQAIAEAWKRESMENQEKWRRVDADVKVRYNTPVRLPRRKTKM
ncbi:hypothetical protein CPB83DRAFT_856384 [Crepidotus variabilis]|uniref:Uncharacterized protein n=1 Tax=Crepidotus variabilis TaxID=179855 RepID=A0A9P6EE27_9AGAR|nr:hypothetical protein CPB83DRAFT_856384 [Crepidotus variabilis]